MPEEKKKRIIKFRAWDKREKKMYACAGFLSGQVILSLENGKVLGKKDDDFELMQFTGLLDKNGKEIYEGDIVGYLCANKELEREYSGIIRFGKVNIGANGFEYDYWINGFYCERIRNHQPDEYVTSHLIEDNDVEVISNIYENPEMVEEEEKK